MKEEYKEAEAVNIKERKVITVKFNPKSFLYETRESKGYRTLDLSFRHSFIERVKKERRKGSHKARG